MTLICNKCSNTFSSTYVLEKHLNRQTPCDVIIQCMRCEKRFKKNQELINHKNRKFPCKITNLNFEREEREKDRELKLHLENQKNATKEKEIIAKENKSIRETAARAANTQKQMEIAQLKCNNKLELAQVIQSNKISLKEQFPSAVTNITNITNIFVDNIKNTFFDINDMCFTQIANHRHKMYNTIICYNRSGYGNWFIDVFNKYNNTNEMVKHFLRHAYVNDTELNKRCIFYHDIIKQFYAIYINDDMSNNVKQVKHVDYDKDLRQEFINCIKEYITGMLIALKWQNHRDLNNPAHVKSINTIIEMEKLTYILNNAFNLVCCVLDISNEDVGAIKLKYIKYKEEKKEAKKIKMKKKNENKTPNVFSGMTTSESE